MLTSTQMEKEAREAPRVIEVQLEKNQKHWVELCERLKKNPPPFAVTIARGSSDHAATFLKYLLEVQLGIPTVSAAPSVLTVYQSHLKLKGALVIAISQSGQSPDLLEMMSSAKASGAITVAIVNQEDSPLARLSEYVVPIHAGKEQAVAATKSYIGSLFAFLHFIGVYQSSSTLLSDLLTLPEQIAKTHRLDGSAFAESLHQASTGGRQNSVILGRGFGYPIAQESALKLKETCALHAEAFSSAEFLHGPLGMIQESFPVILYLQQDQTLEGSLMTAKRIKDAGGRLFMVSPESLNEKVSSLSRNIFELPKSTHPLLESVMAISAFYPIAAKLSVLRGMNPDQPKLLKKVTETR
jgi:glucosamine--fructose-6-phosphate aminotransferase (isomerizing)